MTKETHHIERERSHYIDLLVANPNHFGNLADSGLPAVKKMLGNTKFEQLGCVGYNPVLDMLEATVAIKLPFGYGGDLCSPGHRVCPVLRRLRQRLARRRHRLVQRARHSRRQGLRRTQHQAAHLCGHPSVPAEA